MKKLLFLTAAFLGLLAFVYFYEIVGEEGRNKEKEREESLLRLDESAITGVTIARAGEPEVTLIRTEGGWMIESPVKDRADQSTVNALLDALTGARRERMLEDISDLAEFGLDDPRTRVRLTTADGPVELSVGAGDFSGASNYVKLGGGEIFLTQSSLASAVEKPPFDWRDKAALVFSPEEVEEVEIVRSGEVLNLVLKTENWQLTSPLTDAAQDSTVADLLASIEAARVQEIVEEAPDSLAAYGLDHPAVSVSLKVKGSDEPLKLDLGRQTDGGRVFARDRARQPVFQLPSQLLEDLNQEVLAFRLKDVIEVKQDRVATLELKKGDSYVQIRHDEFRWLIEKPEADAGQEVPSYKLWYPVSDMTYTSLTDGKGAFPEAQLTVTVGLDDGSAVTYEYAREAGVCSARSLETGRGGTVDCESFDRLLELDLEELAEP